MPRNFFDDQSQELRSPFVSDELFAGESSSEQQMLQPDATFESPFLDVAQREDESSGAYGYDGGFENVVSMEASSEHEQFANDYENPDASGASGLEAGVETEQQVAQTNPSPVGKINKMCGHVGYYGVLGRRRQVDYSLDTPNRWICHLIIQWQHVNNSKDMPYVYGTGVLVSPRHVLTAARLVKWGRHDGRTWGDYRVKSILVSPGRNGGEGPLDNPWANVVATAPGWDPKKPSPEHDYALLELDKAIGDVAYSKLGNAKLSYWGHRSSGAVARALSDQVLLDEAVWVTGYNGVKNQNEMHRSQGRVIHPQPGTFVVTAQTFEKPNGAPVWAVVDGKICLVGMMVTPALALRVTPAVCATLQGWLKNASDICSGNTSGNTNKEIDDEAGYGYERREAAEDEAPSTCGCGCRNKKRTEGNLFDPSQLEADQYSSDESGAYGEYQSADYNDLESSSDEPGESEAGTWSDESFDGESRDVVKISKESWSDSEETEAYGESVDEGPFGDMENQVSGGKAVRARILYPALGFPAVIAPSKQPTADADASRCITLLILSDKGNLTSEDVAAYLRCVPWTKRARRSVPQTETSAVFAANEITIRKPKVTGQPRKPSECFLIEFGGTAAGAKSISASLPLRVDEIYRKAGLQHRYEIRISEQASSRFGEGRYQLLWNNAVPGDEAPSDEMALLLREFAAPTRSREVGKLWATHKQYLMDEYEYEYGSIHPPYCSTGTARRRAEILHPLFVKPSLPQTIAIGHLTDLHVNGRADVYEHNLQTAVDRLKAEKSRRMLTDEEIKLLDTMGTYNNWTKTVAQLYTDAKQDSHVLLMTGDLVDYGREHWGQDAAAHLQDDDLYHQDRPWFYFSWLLSRDDAYSTPVYTSLGNHDWRINPYPPLGVGAPSPANYFSSLPLTKDGDDEAKLKKRRLEIAHGDGHARKFSYKSKAESIFDLAYQNTKDFAKTLVRLIAQKSTMNEAGTPAETKIAAIEWYLLSINPFLDYSFTLPSGHQILMLDWAEEEDVLFPINYQGKKWAYMPWQAETASEPGPKARLALTGLQKLLVEKLMKAPGRAKVVTVHAPPIGPWPDWYDEDLKIGRKMYSRADVGKSRGSQYGWRNPDGTTTPWHGHPLFATTPKDKSTGMTADYGSFQKERDWFITKVGENTGIRLVFSGHIHRRGLYVVHKVGKELGKLLEGERLVYGVSEHAVGGAKFPSVAMTTEGQVGPLYVNSTCAGPFGNLYPAEGKYAKAMPGYTHAELDVDGTVACVQFRNSNDSVAGRRSSGPRCAIRKVS